VQEDEQEPSDEGLPSPGDLVAGKYRLSRVIGRGGMGVVYAANHELLGQSVALKVLRPSVARNATTVARFVNEGRAAARLENIHVARVMDVGTIDGGLPFLVFEFLDGADLSVVLEARGPLPFTMVVDYLMEALEAIAEAHSVGIVHRDLKPSNLFLARRKDGDVIKVLDFGIAKAITDTTGPGGAMTSTQAVLGSPSYMSPEQLRSAKNIDARADIWSLGVIAYELLTGALPFEAQNVVALFAIIQETDPRPLGELRPDVPPGLVAAVHACLRRSASDRFACVTDLAQELAPHGSPPAAVSLQRIRAILPGPRPVARSGLDFAPLESRSARTDVGFTATLPAYSPASLAVSNGGAVSPVAQTTDGVISQRTPGLPTRRNRVLLVAAGVALAAAVLGGGVLAMRGGSHPANPAATATATATPVTSTVPPSPEPEPTPAAAATTTAAVTTATATTKASVTTTRATATARSTSTPRPSCNPPYTIDSAGRRIPKPECL
jgi:serine/threonine protein kinase